MVGVTMPGVPPVTVNCGVVTDVVAVSVLTLTGLGVALSAVAICGEVAAACGEDPPPATMAPEAIPELVRLGVVTDVVAVRVGAVTDVVAVKLGAVTAPAKFIPFVPLTCHT